MKFSINISGWSARAPGLKTAEEWLAWVENDSMITPEASLGKLTHLPMMIARRLNSGSRLALDAALDLYQSHQPDALLFTCRHGELERNFRILTALAENTPVSPTDFALSVHNSAVGNLAIMLKSPRMTSSLSAGEDTFHQGLIEAVALLNDGFTRILLVDFEGAIPEFYQPDIEIHYPFSCALIIEKGDDYQCQWTAYSAEQQKVDPPVSLPHSLDFLRHTVRRPSSFTISTPQSTWCWQAKGS